MSQKNEILFQIERCPLDLRDFEWSEDRDQFATSQHSEILTHRPSGFRFAISQNPLNEDFDCVYSPGDEVEEEVARIPLRADPFGDPVQEYGWPVVLERISHWLSYLAREIEAPDLWEAISQQQLSSIADLPDNTLFSADEQRRLATELEGIKRHLIENVRPIERLGERIDELEEHIDARFDYLTEATGRVGRKDWLHILFTVLTQTLYALAFDSERAIELGQSAIAAIGKAIGQALDYLPPHP